MSASYYFKCNKCQEVGGQYTRQAWGWGNFYVVDTFKFLAFHTEHCGPQHICVISENDVDATIFSAKNDIDFIRKTKDYFPAYETQFDGKNLMDYDHSDIKEKWYKEKLNNLRFWYDNNHSPEVEENG